MNKTPLSLLTAGVAALLFSCSGDVIEPEREKLETQQQEQPVQNTAKLTITVLDGVEGTPLEGAEVTLMSSDKLDSTSKAGAIAFDSVPVGAHYLLIEKAGYASMVVTAEITAHTTERNLYMATDLSKTSYLFPLEAGLEGFLYYPDASGKPVPAKDALVYVNLNSPAGATGGTLVGRIDSAKVDANGKYSFATLPAGVGYSIYATGSAFGYGYLALTSQTLRKGYVASIGVNTFSQTSNNSVFMVMDYPTTINVGDREDSIVFKFSNKIDPDFITRSSVAFGSEFADFEVKNDSIIITPFEKWKSNFTVTFTISSVKSIDGKTLATGANSFPIIVQQRDLSEVAIKPELEKKSQTSVDLKWSRKDIDGDETFTIYRKIENEVSYTALSLTAANTIRTADSIIARNVALGSGDSSRTVSFMVVANNGTTKSLMDTSSRLDVKEVVFMIASKPDTITFSKRSEPITFKFSNKIDMSLPHTVNAISGETYKETWDDSTVTLTPATQWKQNFNVVFNSALRSIDGKTLPTSTYAVVVMQLDLSSIAIEPVLASQVNYNSNSATIKWSKKDIDGDVDRIVIYRKIEGESQNTYTQFSEQNFTSQYFIIDGDSVSTSVAFGSAINGRTVSFMVQAINATSRSKLDTEKRLDIIDNAKPDVSNTKAYSSYGDSTITVDAYYRNGGSFNSIYLNDYYIANDTDNRFVLNSRLDSEDADENYACLQINFSEPMDTTAALTGAFAIEIDSTTSAATVAQLGAKLGVVHRWKTCNGTTGSEMALSLIMSIKEGTPIAPGALNVKYSIGGLKDKSQGNPLEIKYAAPAIDKEIIKSTVDVRFKATIAAPSVENTKADNAPRNDSTLNVFLYYGPDLNSGGSTYYPSDALNSNSQYGNIGRLLEAADEAENYVCMEIRFTKDMDTTAALTGAFVAETDSDAGKDEIDAKLGIERKWASCRNPGAVSNRTLSLIMSVKEDGEIDAGSEVNARYSIGGLKDKYGYPIGIKYFDAGNEITKNTADIRITTTVQ